MTETASLMEKVPKLVVFLHDSGNSRSNKCYQMLSDSVTLFSGDLIFVVLSSNKAPELSERIGATAPRLLFYFNSTLWSHFDFPSSETTLLYMLHLFAFGRRLCVHSNKELHMALGSSPYSLLYPDNMIGEAVSVHRHASSLIGFLDLVSFSKALSEELGLNYSTLYLFRLDDVKLLPISTNVTEVALLSRPDFSRITPDDFNSGTGLVFGIVLKSMTEFHVKVLDFVSHMGLNLSICYIDPPYHDITNMTVGGSIVTVPSFVLFSNIKRLYYPIPKSLSTMLIDENLKVFDHLESFLKLLPEACLPSENETSSNDPYIKRLIGKNHDDFVFNQNTDSFIMYESINSMQTKRFYRVFSSIAKEIKESGSSIRFGVINVTANAAQYPSLPSLPHFEFYPYKNISNEQTFYGQSTREDFIRFVKKYSSDPVSIIVPEATPKELSLELIQIYVDLPHLNDIEASKADFRLRELAPVLGVDIDDMNKALFKQLESKAENTTKSDEL